MKKSIFLSLLTLVTFSSCTEENNIYLQNQSSIDLTDVPCGAVYNQFPYVNVDASLAVYSQTLSPNEWNLDEAKVVVYKIYYIQGAVPYQYDLPGDSFQNSDTSVFENVNGKRSCRLIHIYLNQNSVSFLHSTTNPVTITQVRVQFKYRVNGETNWRFTEVATVEHGYSCNVSFYGNKVK